MRSVTGADDPLAGRVDPDGFVDTGDLARVDDDGFVWIEGRAGDLINRGGNKVFPDAVEEVLLLHPAVRDAGVVGEPDERLGEVPVAYVVTDQEVADAELDRAVPRASRAVQGAGGVPAGRRDPPHRRRQDPSGRRCVGAVVVTYATLEVRRDGPVGWLVFDRPDAANAMDELGLAAAV